MREFIAMPSMRRMAHGMASPWRGTSLVERIGVEESGMGDLYVSLCLVKHAPEKAKQTGVYKSGRPVSFFFAPTDGFEFQYQILKKPPSVWCAGFVGSTYEHSLEEFRAAAGYCSMAEYFRHGGRAAQVYDSSR